MNDLTWLETQYVVVGFLVLIAFIAAFSPLRPWWLKLCLAYQNQLVFKVIRWILMVGALMALTSSYHNLAAVVVIGLCLPILMRWVLEPTRVKWDCQ